MFSGNFPPNVRKKLKLIVVPLNGLTTLELTYLLWFQAWPYSLVNRGTSETVEDNHSFSAAKTCSWFIGDKAMSCVDWKPI